MHRSEKHAFCLCNHHFFLFLSCAVINFCLPNRRKYLFFLRVNFQLTSEIQISPKVLPLCVYFIYHEVSAYRREILNEDSIIIFILHFFKNELNFNIIIICSAKWYQKRRILQRIQWRHHPKIYWCTGKVALVGLLYRLFS